MNIELIRIRRYPKMEKAFYEAASGIFKSVTGHGFVGRFRMRSQPEGGRTTIVENEEGRHSFPMEGYRGEICVTEDEIIETDIGSIQRHLVESALKFARKVNAGFFKQMTELVQKYGQRVKASDCVTDGIIRGLQGMALTFENDGRVSEGLVLYIPGGQIGKFFAELGMKDMAKAKAPPRYVDVPVSKIYEWCAERGESGTEEARKIVKVIGEKRAAFDAEESNRKLVD